MSNTYNTSDLYFYLIIPVFIYFISYVIKYYADPKSSRKEIMGENKGKSGIYLWTNKINGKSYVGQAKELGGNGRIDRYYRPSYLTSPVLGNSAIRSALAKYGMEGFTLSVLEYCPVELLTEREQY